MTTLNRKLVADKFPLPRTDDILDGLGRARYFSCLDLFSPFHQIKLDKKSREYTAFSSDKGSFQWTVLPFGLNIAPNSFCRMMGLAFADVKRLTAFPNIYRRFIQHLKPLNFLTRKRTEFI